MSFRLDRNSALTYAAQIRHQAEAQLVAGRLTPGDRLPSVRQLARQLRISRTTAERIHQTLCEAMLVEMRPRSGAFVASPMADRVEGTQWAHAVYDFLTQVTTRAEELGIDRARLAQLVGALAQDPATRGAQQPVCFPLVATRDACECMSMCLDESLPIRLVPVSPTAPQIQIPRRIRYILSGYYMRQEARKIAEATGSQVVYVRYNVKLLDSSMAIPAHEHRYFVTRDGDNAETTRVFLASAYPEVPAQRYRVLPVEEWLNDPAAVSGTGQVWVTVTAVDQLRDRVSRARLRRLHPILADDFIEELRCLALCG
jgi:GntR family transcriptional regulator